MATKKLVNILEKEFGAVTFAIFMMSARTMKDMNQTQMAKFLKISKSTLCDIEKGRQFVSAALAAKIAKKCGLHIESAVQAALNDQLAKSGLKYTVHLEKVS
jgi:DNA-binding XRE family transcriptional regulator